MYEDILIVLLGAVASFLLLLVIAWFTNSRWARDLEKKKKKYDVKLERYSEVYENLELLRILGHVWNLRVLVNRRIEGEEKPTEPVSEVETDTLLTQYLGQFEVLMSRLGREVQKSLFEDFSRKTFMGIAFDEIESIEKDEMEDRIKETLQEHWVDLSKCLVTVLTRLERSLSRIKVIGAKEVAEDVERLIVFFLALIFREEFLVKEVETLDKQISEMFKGWAPSVDSVEGRLESDLEKTL